MPVLHHAAATNFSRGKEIERRNVEKNKQKPPFVRRSSRRVADEACHGYTMAEKKHKFPSLCLCPGSPDYNADAVKSPIKTLKVQLNCCKQRIFNFGCVASGSRTANAKLSVGNDFSGRVIYEFAG